MRPSIVIASKDHVEHARETVHRLQVAWNNKNAYLWSTAFLDPCDYIDVFGHFHKNWSRDANASLHQKVWAGVYAISHMTLSIEKIDFLSDRHCVMVLGCHLQYQINGNDKTNDTIITIMMVRAGMEWLIRNFQNTAFRPY
jgi:uncharacterized protein (TIGR02246 family)